MPDMIRVPVGFKEWNIPCNLPLAASGILEKEDFSQNIDRYCVVKHEGSKAWSHHECEQHDLFVFWY